ncbi:MAG TPA: penicillin-binding protein 1C [Oligoflexus sp.]|uniref:penicillin-binding protein 1C n=1 Tax=Oligoflexus sp. TaxID=1971216 RepID=UPI002D80ADB1|nr:penicillin-binding protein 1C [Oligoflexus sp.]HET9240564.1 penicillin-binding protein 1C [Oligoflexus sp.]
MPLSRWIKSLLIGSLILGLLPLIYIFAPGSVPGFTPVKNSWQMSDQKILDRHGKLLLTTRVDKQRRRLDWLPLDAVAPVFMRTLIRIEDQRFYQHGGIDARGFLAMLGQRRGGSSLTMQLAAHLNPKLKAQGKFRRPWQKLQQMRMARLIEQSWSKEEILEAYVNLVSFRGELQGLEAASQALMQKAAHGLNAEEALLLTASLGLPNAPWPVIARRACRLRSIVAVQTDCAGIERLARKSLNRAPELRSSVRLAPHLAALVAASSQDVRSTLDRRIQEVATQALHTHLAAIQAQNVHDGAVLVVDNATAEVLAYVGSSEVTTRNLFVDMARGARQAGSSLKPLLYAEALNQKLITAASLLEDTPISLPTSSGLYVPRNYDEQYHGTVTVREALASSLNIPAVRVIDMLGVPAFVAKLRGLGFDKLADTENYGHSLALGAADISPWELAGAYVSLAHGGVYRPLKLFLDEPTASQNSWLRPGAAFVISHILSDRSARSLTFGLENPLATPFWTAVKTGTSKDMRDNWCAGYSSRYTVVVWVGNADGSPMWNVTGISGAAPVWRDVMNALHAEEASVEPAAPAGLVLAKFWDANGKLREDWFLEGTAPDQQKLADRRWSLKIQHPLDGTLIAFDPDIPETQQALFFEASARLPPGAYWVLDGEKQSQDRVRLSELANGTHRLEIQNREGRRLDAASFEVRGGTGIQVSQRPR